MNRRITGALQYAFVFAAITIHLALIAIQYLPGIPLWIAELSRFIPFYWLLIPLLASVFFAIGLPLAVLLAATVNVALLLTLTMGFQWQWPAGDDPPGTRIRVVTYNVKALSARRKTGGLDAIDREVRLYQPDIVALQDAQGWRTEEEARTLVFAHPIFGLPHVRAVGQYVLASRFPLQSCEVGEMGVGTPPTQYLRCQAMINFKPVELVTVHLVSPRHALATTRHEFFDGLPEWRFNLANRLTQSRSLLADVSRLAHPLVVMGDFNASERSAVVSNFKLAGLRDTFSEAGRGWGYTHGHALAQGVDLYRIDHILVSPDISTMQSGVGGGQASEHNPVIADLVIRP